MMACIAIAPWVPSRALDLATVRSMLGQGYKLPGTAALDSRAASSCNLAPMHAHANLAEAKVWQLAKTGNIANLKLHNTVVAAPMPTHVTVAVKAVRVKTGYVRFL